MPARSPLEAPGRTATARGCKPPASTCLRGVGDNTAAHHERNADDAVTAGLLAAVTYCSRHLAFWQ